MYVRMYVRVVDKKEGKRKKRTFQKTCETRCKLIISRGLLLREIESTLRVGRLLSRYLRNGRSTAGERGVGEGGILRDNEEEESSNQRIAILNGFL